MQDNSRSSPTLIIAALVALLAVFAVAFFAWQARAKAASGVIFMRTDAPFVTAYLIWPNPDAPPGLAHYVEHLAWLNAVAAQERDIDRHSNAWTSDDAIGYWLSGAPDDLQDVLETLLQTALPLTLDPEFAAEERDVVMREYDLSFAGNIDEQVNERADQFLYSGNQKAKSIIGSRSDIEALTYDAARAFHQETHKLDAATLVVLGNVSRRDVGRALRNLGHDESSFGAAQVAAKPFVLGEPTTRQFRFPGESLVPRMQLRKVVRLDEPIAYDVLEANAFLLQDILESNVPGGLAGPLRFDASFARSFQIGLWPIDEQHVEFYISAPPDRGVTLATLTARIEEVLQTTAADGIPIGTYRRIKDRFGGFWPDWSDTEQTQDWMAEYIVDRSAILRRPLNKTSVQNLQTEISHTTVNTLLRAIAGEGRTAVTFVGPEGTFE